MYMRTDLGFFRLKVDLRRDTLKINQHPTYIEQKHFEPQNNNQF